MLETLFNSEYWETFQGTYFEEHLQTVASENVYETEKSLIQNIGKLFRAPILKNICKRLRLKMFMKLRKV